MNKKASYIIIFICGGIALQAQKGIELGGWLGLSNYYGDLKTNLSFAEPRGAGGLVFRYNFDERIAIKSSINYARIHAEDADSDNTYEFNRGLSFRSDVFELTNQLEFNFFPYLHGSDDHNWTPYLFGGLTALTFSPKTQLAPDGPLYDLRSYGTEGQPIGGEYGKWTWAMAYGMGVKWDINYDWSFNVELGLRTTNTDYLDDVSGFYPDLDELRRLRGQTAATLSDPTNTSVINRQRGNDKNNDTYILFGVSIMRYFGRVECPKISPNR
jgi:hypothetical protein